MKWPLTWRSNLVAAERGWREATDLCHRAMALSGRLQAENVELRDKLLLQTTKANRLAETISEGDQAFFKQCGIEIK
jgi:hypothetical protein